MNYRITTTDGFILDECPSHREATRAAVQRARYMAETMLVLRWSEAIGWCEVDRVR